MQISDECLRAEEPKELVFDPLKLMNVLKHRSVSWGQNILLSHIYRQIGEVLQIAFFRS